MDSFKEFIKPELLILIPVLYLIGVAVKKSNVNNARIPIILGICGVALSILYTLATTPVSGSQEVATLLFTGITQGILAAGASVYVNQIGKQLQNTGDDTSNG